MSIVFDEIVGTVAPDRADEEGEEKEEQRKERPLTLATLRLIHAQTKRFHYRQTRLIAD